VFAAAEPSHFVEEVLQQRPRGFPSLLDRIAVIVDSYEGVVTVAPVSPLKSHRKAFALKEGVDYLRKQDILV